MQHPPQKILCCTRRKVGQRCKPSSSMPSVPTSLSGHGASGKRQGDGICCDKRNNVFKQIWDLTWMLSCRCCREQLSSRPSAGDAAAHVPRVLTIAGSDSGGGAGIQADIKTCVACGAFAATAITAITAQNTHGVSAVHIPPAVIVRQQIQAVVQDIGVDCFKTGMLPTAEVTRLHGFSMLKLRPEFLVCTCADGRTCSCRNGCP
jgi:hypothetical protein